MALIEAWFVNSVQMYHQVFLCSLTLIYKKLFTSKIWYLLLGIFVIFTTSDFKYTFCRLFGIFIGMNQLLV